MCFLLIVMSPGKGNADNLSFNFDQNYSRSESETAGSSSSSSRSTRNYSLNVNKTLTKTINISGTLRATESSTESGSGVKTETFTVAPSVFANMNNPYFSLSGGFHSNFLPYTSVGDDVRNTQWNTSLSTRPSKFPPLTISYSKTNTYDTLAVRKVDVEGNSLNANTSYNLLGIDMGYNFTRSENKNLIGSTKQINSSHLGTANYSNSLFNNKVRYSLNFGASESNSKNTSLSPTLFDDEKGAATGLFLGLDSSPHTGLSLPSNGALTNNNTGVAVAGIDLRVVDNGIGVELTNPETINKIFLYVTNPAGNTTPPAPVSFGWKVFINTIAAAGSGGFPPAWTEVTAFTVLFDTVNQRFEFAFTTPQTARFFKVVNTAGPAEPLPIGVTEIEAIGSINQTLSRVAKTSNERQFGGVDLNWKATDNLTTNYSFNYNRTDRSPEDVETQNLSQNVNGSYRISNKSSLFAGYTNQRNLDSKGPDRSSNSYTASLSTNPIETINGSMSFTRFESKEEGDLLTASNSANLNTFFKLYHGIDLGAGLSGNITKSKDTKTTSKSANGNLNLRPRKSINVVFNGTVTGSTTKTGGVEITSSSEFLNTLINFNPSRHLNFSSNIGILPEFTQNYSVSSRLPGTLQTTINYNRSNSGVDSIGISVTLSPSSYIFISSSYQKTFTHNTTGDTSSTFRVNLSLRK